MLKYIYTIAAICMIAFTTSGQTPYLVKPNPVEGPGSLIEYKGKLLFRTKTAEFGRELWQSDGTEEGTRMLKNINEDPNVSGGDSDPVVLTKFKNLVFFAATDAIHGRKLWVTDGTEEGTRFFKDIILSNGNAHIIFEDKLFFVAYDEIHGFELWVSDGTSEGTRLLMDINPGIGNGSPWGFTLADGYFFFSADNGVNGRELWRSDGTPENTYMIKDILPGPSGSILNFTNGFFEQGKYYLAASDNIHGNEVWMSDGTEAGTVLLKDIRPGTSGSSPGSFFSSLGYVYFLASPTALRSLYTTNGTTAGTVIANQLQGIIISNLSYMVSVAPGVFVCSSATSSGSGRLWLLLTLGELVLIDEIVVDPEDPNASSFPTAFMDCGHGLYFNANTIEAGRQLFYLSYEDFTPVQITEITPAPSQGFNIVGNPVRVGNKFFFAANDFVSGSQLWAMDPPYSQLVVSDGASEVPSGDTIDFGRILVGQSIDTSIFLRNSGTASLRLLNADELNPQYFSAEINTDTIAAGDSVEVRLSYTAQALGTYLDTLAFLSLSVADKTYTVVLKVQVVEPAAVINIFENEQPVESGALLNFGTVLLGADSLRSIRIVNSGTISLDISNIQTTGIHFSAQNIPTSISPGSSENIEIRFIPTVAGEHTGSLSFNTNDTDYPSFVLNLAGTGQMASRVHTLAEMGISVFPNPVDAVLFVKFQQAPVKGTAVVLNATGQVLKKLDVSQGELSEISVKELPNGVYMLQISLEDRSGAIQFIKQ